MMNAAGETGCRRSGFMQECMQLQEFMPSSLKLSSVKFFKLKTETGLAIYSPTGTSLLVPE